MNLPTNDHSQCAPPWFGGCQHGSLSCPERPFGDSPATHTALPISVTKALADYHRGISSTTSEEYPTSWHRQMADLLDPPPPHVSLHERAKNAIANVYIDSAPDTPANTLARRAAGKVLTLVEEAVSTIECANCAHPTDASASGCYVSHFRQKVLELLGERMEDNMFGGQG